MPDTSSWMDQLLAAMSGWQASDLFVTEGKVPAVRLHALPLREGLGHVDEHRSSVAELAVARLREGVRVDLRASVAPVIPETRGRL